MKLVSIAAIILTGIVSHASEVKLAWDPSPSTNVAGYFLYAGTNQPSVTNVYARVNAGTNLTVRIDFLNTGHWFFWATAYDDLHVESDPSNVLQIEVPAPPERFRTLAIQATADLSGTNWNTVGFLRVKLE